MPPYDKDEIAMNSSMDASGLNNQLDDFDDWLGAIDEKAQRDEQAVDDPAATKSNKKKKPRRKSIGKKANQELDKLKAGQSIMKSNLRSRTAVRTKQQSKASTERRRQAKDSMDSILGSGAKSSIGARPSANNRSRVDPLGGSSHGGRRAAKRNSLLQKLELNNSPGQKENDGSYRSGSYSRRNENEEVLVNSRRERDSLGSSNHGGRMRPREATGGTAGSQRSGRRTHDELGSSTHSTQSGHGGRRSSYGGEDPSLPTRRGRRPQQQASGLQPSPNQQLHVSTAEGKLIIDLDEDMLLQILAGSGVADEFSTRSSERSEPSRQSRQSHQENRSSHNRRRSRSRSRARSSRARNLVKATKSVPEQPLRKTRPTGERRQPRRRSRDM